VCLSRLSPSSTTTGVFVRTPCRALPSGADYLVAHAYLSPTACSSMPGSYPSRIGSMREELLGIAGRMMEKAVFETGLG
jgi:hypothetical protein